MILRLEDSDARLVMKALAHRRGRLWEAAALSGRDDPEIGELQALAERIAAAAALQGVDLR